MTTLNAKAETAKSAASPADAIAAEPRLPAATPSTDAMPTRRPWVALRATMNSTPGPGVMARIKLASRNADKRGHGGRGRLMRSDRLGG